VTLTLSNQALPIDGTLREVITNNYGLAALGWASFVVLWMFSIVFFGLPTGNGMQASIATTNALLVRLLAVTSVGLVLVYQPAPRSALESWLNSLRPEYAIRDAPPSVDVKDAIESGVWGVIVALRYAILIALLLWVTWATWSLALVEAVSPGTQRLVLLNTALVQLVAAVLAAILLRDLMKSWFGDYHWKDPLAPATAAGPNERAVGPVEVDDAP